MLFDFYEKKTIQIDQNKRTTIWITSTYFIHLRYSHFIINLKIYTYEKHYQTILMRISICFFS